MVSPQYLRYAAGSEKEKGAGGRLHGGTIAHSFVFCNGGVAGASDSGVRPLMGTDGFVLACALDQRRVWLGVRCCPTGPPSNVFGQGDSPCTPGGGCAPCTLLGGQGYSFATSGGGFLTCPEHPGQGQRFPAGGSFASAAHGFQRLNDLGAAVDVAVAVLQATLGGLPWRFDYGPRRPPRATGLSPAAPPWNRSRPPPLLRGTSPAIPWSGGPPLPRRRPGSRNSASYTRPCSARTGRRARSWRPR